MTGSDVPFDPIPPLTLVPPRVDPSALEFIAKVDVDRHGEGAGEEVQEKHEDAPEQTHLRALTKRLPSNSIIDPSKVILPIRDASDVRSATRLVYAMNQYGEGRGGTDGDGTNLHEMKERVALGFEVLKSLNQLSEMLEERKETRKDHEDREGVAFRVGQGEREGLC